MNRNLESLLNELGAARAAGVFPTTDAAPASFPWQTKPATLAHRGLRWVRLAIPVAAAAALAFIFVGPGTSQKNVANLATDGAAPVTTALVSVSGRADDCNGDGVVNGLDIECYVRHHADKSQAPELQTEAFTRRLLGI